MLCLNPSSIYVVSQSILCLKSGPYYVYRCIQLMNVYNNGHIKPLKIYIHGYT